MLPPGPVLEHPTSTASSIPSGVYSGLDPFIGLYIRTAKLVWGILIVTFILRPFSRASSSSSLVSSLDRDSSDDYPEIGASICRNTAEDDCLIFMVAPNGDQSRNNSSGYPTIGRSKAYDV
jgi:hypothetical protein